MTKRDFEVMARQIAKEAAAAHANPDFQQSFADLHACNIAAIIFADVAILSNPSFNRARFMQACGVSGQR